MSRAAIHFLLIAVMMSFGVSAEAFMPIWKSRKNVWKTLSDTNRPSSSVTQQRAVRLGQKIYVWGGYNGGGVATGHIFDLETNTWSAMPTTGSPPSPRYRHEMAVVGTKIIVWGGQATSAAASRLNTGSYFDTATNTWTAMSTSGAPSARGLMAVVSTGTRVIVWGGGDTAGAVLGDGKIYDPGTNTWPVTISPTNAPAARAWLSANTVVWTGSKLFIWGANVGGTCTNTGGLYDPVGNSWQVIPTSGAPTGRCFSSAAWTGSKVIVWGGDSASGSGTLYNTGGIYDPSTNTWVGSTATTGAPTGRHWHAGVWTLAGLLVWGGQDGGGDAPNGKLYDPSLDAWFPISMTNTTIGQAADVRMISFDHFVFHFDQTNTRLYFP